MHGHRRLARTERYLITALVAAVLISSLGNCAVRAKDHSLLHIVEWTTRRDTKYVVSIEPSEISGNKNVSSRPRDGTQSSRQKSLRIEQVEIFSPALLSIRKFRSLVVLVLTASLPAAIKNFLCLVYLARDGNFLSIKVARIHS